MHACLLSVDSFPGARGPVWLRLAAMCGAMGATSLGLLPASLTRQQPAAGAMVEWATAGSGAGEPARDGGLGLAPERKRAEHYA